MGVSSHSVHILQVHVLILSHTTHCDFESPKRYAYEVLFQFRGAVSTGFPKGPSRTKNTTESDFRHGKKIRCGRSKILRRGLRNACFSRKKRQENGTESENLRRLRNTTDSSAVLFLVRKGPLDFLNFLQWIFFLLFLQGFLCNLVRNSPP